MVADRAGSRDGAGKPATEPPGASGILSTGAATAPAPTARRGLSALAPA